MEIKIIEEKGNRLEFEINENVGFLNALHALKDEKITQLQLAEEAFDIAHNDLKLPDGKQDYYATAMGDFCVLEIAKDGIVDLVRPNISQETRSMFEKQLLLFYSGVSRLSENLLNEQQNSVREGNETIIELKHETKRIGREILSSFEKGDLDQYGNLLHQHWELKKRMAVNMTSPFFDSIYTHARKNGALGGKIVGAGGGGFFMVFFILLSPIHLKTTPEERASLFI